jgi:hypothetical protein
MERGGRTGTGGKLRRRPPAPRCMVPSGSQSLGSQVDACSIRQLSVRAFNICMAISCFSVRRSPRALCSREDSVARTKCDGITGHGCHQIGVAG